MENNAAVKRPLDEGVESNAKRSKTADDLQMLLPIEDIRNIRDPRKRKQLPFVVYELLKLFKQSENVYSEVDEKVKNISDTEKVLQYENSKENNECIENNCLLKAGQEEDEAPKETIDFKNLTPTKSVSLTSMTTSSESINSTSTQTVSTQSTSTPKSVSCTPISTKTIFDVTVTIPDSINCQTLACTSIKNDSGVASVSTPSESIPMSVTISITPTSIPKIDSCTPISTTIVSGVPEESVSTKSGPNNVYKVSLREQILNLLKVHCSNGISEVPTSKPPRCICQYCKHVDNLPMDKSAINNKFTQFKNNENLHTDMYSSDLAASDSEAKDIWVNELSSLIRKNDESHKVPVPTASTSNTLTSIKSVISKVYKVAEKRKPYLSFCIICKKSQLAYSSTCINCQAQLKNNEFFNPPRYENRNYKYKYGNNTYRYY